MNNRPIVCALDSSDVARPTLERAAALAAWRSAELHVVHVQRRGAFALGSSYDAARPDEIEDGERARLSDLLTVSGASPDAVRLVFYRGDPAAAIIGHAKAHAADLVVVGSRPFRQLRRYRGTVASSVARGASCPVLIVPADQKDATRDTADHFNQIVCGVDFSDASAAALTHALMLAQESGGRLHAIHVLDGLPDELIVSGGRAQRFLREFEAIKARADARLRAAIPAESLNWCDVEVRIVGGIPRRELVRAADEVGADLIVVGARPRSVLDRAIAGATISSLLRRAHCAVLTVPASAALASRAGKVPTIRFDVAATALGGGAHGSYAPRLESRRSPRREESRWIEHR